MRCDEYPAKTMNTLEGELNKPVELGRGHNWIVVEWEDRDNYGSASQAYGYTSSYSVPLKTGSYVTAKKLMCSYCRKIIPAEVSNV